MELIGGLLRGAELATDVRFRPVTGELELLVAEAGRRPRSLPDRVTEVLSAALERLGGLQATRRAVGALCVGDRQHLMRQLAVRLGVDQVWLTASCGHCRERFDVPVEQSALPVKRAGASFPQCDVQLGAGRVRVRVPSGDDQRAVAEIQDAECARQVLASRLVVEPAGFDPSMLHEAELEQLDAAIEAMAPEVTEVALAQCPACAAANEVLVDPYLCLQLGGTEILDDVHLIASTYHWSEKAILRLPRERRRDYLERIDRERGGLRGRA